MGIVYGLLACMFWGLSYVIPSFISGFSTFEIVMGRFVIYGLLSTCLLLYQGTDTCKALVRHLPLACFLALFGFLAYDLLDVAMIRGVGPYQAGLLSAISIPISATVANFRSALPIPWKHLSLALSLVCVGAVLSAQGSCATDEGFISIFDRRAVMVVALETVLWSGFCALINRSSRLSAELTPAVLTSLMGVGCLLIACIVMVPYVLQDGSALIHWCSSHPPKDLLYFILASLVAGILISWMATELWCRASVRLSSTVIPFFLVGDVVFGHVYTYFGDLSDFSIWETLGSVCVIAAAVYTSFRQPSEGLAS